MSALHTFQSAAQNDSDVLMFRTGRKGATPSTRMGGGEVRNLTLWMHAETGGACIMCGGETNVYGEVAHPETATLAVLIPCAMLDDAQGIYRYGYVPGNVALAHVGCSQARNAFGLASGSPVCLMADEIDTDLVPMEWPKARKARSAAQDEDAATALLSRRIAAGLPF